MLANGSYSRSMKNPKDHSEESKQSLGGQARAAKLTPAERSEISRRAAEARWAGGVIPKETHAGILKIGEQELPCAVLDNGLRVFSMNGLSRVFGSRKKGRDAGNVATPSVPPFLATQSIKPFIPDELMTPLLNPIFYKSKYGITATGYPATILPTICETLIDAAKGGGFYQAGAQRIEAVRERAERLLRGFARVGVIALVDEVTGYQEERAKNELTRILEAYIAPELMPWTRKFPDEFFKQVYRLHHWEYKPENAKKGPRYVGKLINKYVYDELPPGVPAELRRLNPPNEKGQRKHKLFQKLTADTGNEHLDRQISHVTLLMRIASSNTEFERLFERAFPKKKQIEIPGVLDLDDLGKE
jgi:hypothetical protein